MKHVDARTLCKLSRANLVAAFALVAMLIAPLTVRAATITVNTLADPTLAANCTLHDAIIAANTQAAVNGCISGTGKNDTIHFSVTGTIALGGTLPAIVSGETLTIQGPGAPGITIDGGSAHQVMVVNVGAVVNLQNLTIAHGLSLDGGGINNAGTLTITNSTFSGNSAFAFGGGIDNAGGTLTVTNCTFSSNSVSIGGAGGGIFNLLGTLSVTNSTFSGNIGGIGNGSGGGGGIGNSGTGTVTNSTFSGNSADIGGGIVNEVTRTTLTVTNSTFSGNRAISFGGGIGSSAPLTVTNSTFSGNSGGLAGGGGIYSFIATAMIKGAILAASTSGGNCGGPTITDGGYNISSDNSCGFSGTSKNNTDPLLDPMGLKNNGGPTKTIALLQDSPAIDKIPVLACTDQELIPQPLTTDQRGFARPDSGDVPPFCDIGAYETTFAGEIILNSSTVQVVHNIGSPTDVLNLSLNVTNIGDPGLAEDPCDNEKDDLLETGVTVAVFGGTCAAFSTLCGSSGCPGLPFDFDVTPYVEHDIGSFSYGTFFGLNGPGSVASKIIKLATPAYTCGTWSINLRATGLNLSSVTTNPIALFLSDSEGDVGCFNVTAQIGSGIVSPLHGLRRLRHH